MTEKTLNVLLKDLLRLIPDHEWLDDKVDFTHPFQSHIPDDARKTWVIQGSVNKKKDPEGIEKVVCSLTFYCGYGDVLNDKANTNILTVSLDKIHFTHQNMEKLHENDLLNLKTFIAEQIERINADIALQPQKNAEATSRLVI